MRWEIGPNGTPAEALWRFSLALYGRPGVAGALIALQDRAALDVDLILYALWCGASRRHRLTAAELAAAAQAAAPFAVEAVAPLRALRRRLGSAVAPDAAALGRRTLALEITAERQVLSRLAAYRRAAAGSDPDRLAASVANLSLCLGDEAGSTEAEKIRGAVAALMRRQT